MRSSIVNPIYQTDSNGVLLVSVSSGVTYSVTYVTGTVTNIGDNQIVAAPASNQSIYVSHIVLQNESSAALTILVKDVQPVLRCLAQSRGDGLAWVFPATKDMKLAAGTALFLNLSAAQPCGYSIGYYIA